MALHPASTLLLTWTEATSAPTGSARAALRRALASLNLHEDGASDAILAVSELVANATEHAPGPYELELRRTTRHLLCEVRDRDPRIPEVAEFRPEAPTEPSEPAGRPGAVEAALRERGRGLLIVDELTGGAWGFRVPGDGTKVAWIAISHSGSVGPRLT
ncbi:ATP-binding protein [Streptomyces chartreusis]|uniref:ATP-binding protein n=1 Tax=Streptomyces chartreusis TaxID=1969 RepID=UPI003712A258